MIESVEMKVSLGVGPCGPPHVFCIHLDNGTGPFYAGEVLSGHVLVQLPAPMQYKSIRVRLLGQEYVFVEESRQVSVASPQHNPGERGQSLLTGSPNAVVVDHRAHRIIVDDSVTLLSEEQSFFRTLDNWLAPGTNYAFPFRLHIPTGAIPSWSFRNGNCCIAYWLECFIDQKVGADYTYSIPVHVHKIIDTNLPIYRSPVERREQSRDCCCCWPFSNGGTIYLSSSIDHGAYAPGDRINFSSEIENESGSVVQCLEVSLVKNLDYKTDSSFIMYDREIVIQHTFPITVQPGQAFKLDESLAVPPICSPVTFEGTLISCRYGLYFEVRTEGCCGSSLVVAPEIIIGNISAGVEPPRRKIEEVKSSAELQAEVPNLETPEAEFWPGDAEPPAFVPGTIRK